VLTVGIDLASLPVHSASCCIEWQDGRAAIVELEVDVDDRRIFKFIATAQKVGIDAPLGWPVAFVDAVNGHSQDGSWPPDYVHGEGTSALRFRRTDQWVWKTLGMPPPLSVSTDRIALPAMRVAALLASLDPRVPLDGHGVVVEVYPAAALRRWGLRSRAYKGKVHAQAREDLVALLRERTAGWFTMEEHHAQLCRSVDDAFDAVVASLVARAGSLGLIEPVPLVDQALARREGWIAVPTLGSLDELAAGDPR